MTSMSRWRRSASMTGAAFMKFGLAPTTAITFTIRHPSFSLSHSAGRNVVIEWRFAGLEVQRVARASVTVLPRAAGPRRSCGEPSRPADGGAAGGSGASPRALVSLGRHRERLRREVALRHAGHRRLGFADPGAVDKGVGRSGKGLEFRQVDGDGRI